MYMLPLTNLENISKKLGSYFGKEMVTRKKFHYLVKWDLVCKPKRKGGLGTVQLLPVMQVVVETRIQRWDVANYS
jgi:hypothetical protein